MNRSNARDGGGWAQVNAKQKNDPYAPTPGVTLVVDTRYRYKPGEVVEVIEGPHKGKELTERQKRENVEAVHRAWKLNADHVRHSLRHAYYQGWDLHPAQLPVRYGALYSFFLEGLDAASARLRNFIEKAAQATLVGDVFDDAATGQGLLNYFLRALNCGAIAEAEIAATGLTLEEIQTRSFMKILDGRKGR